MTTTAALDLRCPACLAPPGTDCTHDDRRRLADLRNLQHGTCNLCGQFMVHGTVLDAPTDAWHPDLTDASACPVIPDPNLDGWDAYAAAINSGLTPGHPGIEHFVPTPPPSAVTCPECRQGKHPNCTRTIPGDTGPEVTPCACLTSNPEAHR